MADDEKKAEGGSRPRYIERKQAFAARQVARGEGVFSRATVRGTGPANSHGLPRLPEGQHEVKNWPVLDLGEVPAIEKADWHLEVAGAVDYPQLYSWQEFMALPQVQEVSDFHCVTTWSRFDNHWGGVAFREIAARAGIRPEAKFVLVEAYDHAPGTEVPYTTNLPLEEAMLEDVLLVHSWEGAPLPREHGGPARMITPQLYAWKGAKWIKRIVFSPVDSPGFWEVRGYSNTAYPWFNDRYTRLP